MTDVITLTYTRREYMVMRAIKRGALFSAAINAVDKAMTRNPKWDTDEAMSWDEWEAFYRDSSET